MGLPIYVIDEENNAISGKGYPELHGDMII